MNNRKNIAKTFAKTINSDKIDKIILFGSVARGDDKDGSDIDILIITENPEDIENYVDTEVSNFLIKNEEFISAHLMSKEIYKQRINYPFLRNVLKEGVILG